MAGTGEDEQLEPFGRVRLDRIYGGWASGHHLNPRLLASELAATIATCSPSDQPIQTLHASVVTGGRADRSIPITFGSLADYFDAASTGIPSLTIQTSSGPVPAAHVLIWRKWIERLVDEATKRTEIAAGFAQPANDSGTFSMVSNGAAAINLAPPLAHLSGSAPVILKAQQAQLRREGEQSAAERLDAEQAARRRSDQDVVELRAQLAYKDAQITQLRDDAEQDRRVLSQAIRQQQEDSDLIISMEERLEDVMALAECLRADNEVSPPEFRLGFECWRTITRDGTHNPAGAGGRGVHGLVEDWLKDNGYKLNKEATERLCAVVSWRKRGAGAIRSQ